MKEWKAKDSQAKKTLAAATLAEQQKAKAEGENTAQAAYTKGHPTGGPCPNKPTEEGTEPVGSMQINALGANIFGCGLEDCSGDDSRLDQDTFGLKLERTDWATTGQSITNDDVAPLS